MEILAADLTVFHHQYASIAAEMGAGLARTAYSPNIKERRDFSCALFDTEGQLLAQAAHIPVHLGAMPRSVDAARAAFPNLEPGDIVLLNDPFGGGTHLPDITLVSPVFHQGELAGYTATRAHHADVGGMTPGSLPHSQSIHQEGLRVPPVRLVRGGEMNPDILRIVCANTRGPNERRGDLRAQINAHHIGENRLRAVMESKGLPVLREINRALMDYAERRMRAALSELPDGAWTHEDVIENETGDGPAATIRARLRKDDEGVTVDFRASDDQVTGSLNAVRAITEAAVYHVFLCWMCRKNPRNPPPVNHGCFRPLRVETLPGSLVDATWPAAVAGGNVETSQRVTDVVMGLLAQAAPEEVPACSQGTMNNVTLGGADAGGKGFAYYETLAGGAGGGPGVPGESAVQCHMTNTLNTPVEALEYAYPLRIHRLEIRGDSGGAGRFPGGGGMVREWEALAPMEATLLTERRFKGPPGTAGGEAGAPGRQFILSQNGEIRPLPAKGAFRLNPGDRLRVETPGGGGWGREGEMGRWGDENIEL